MIVNKLKHKFFRIINRKCLKKAFFSKIFKQLQIWKIIWELKQELLNV